MCTRTFFPEEKKDKPEALLFFFHGIGGHVHRGFVDSKGNPCNDLLIGRTAVEKGWAAFFLDAEGHGHSEGEFIYVPSHYDCVTDALDYITHIVSKYPGVPWFVMGESWGGNISLNLGLQLQKRPEGVNIDDWYGVLLVAPAVIGDLPPCPVVFCLRYCCAPCCPKWTPFFMPNPVSADRIWRDEEVRKYVEEVDELGRFAIRLHA
mmetsp:Transcript_20275/g.28509  ORF Transcript_20275/g.28509 Transcript_20275/m.28509 type:complete len:206 (-) Transcript_20275:649-1266(-)